MLIYRKKYWGSAQLQNIKYKVSGGLLLCPDFHMLIVFWQWQWVLTGEAPIHCAKNWRRKKRKKIWGDCRERWWSVVCPCFPQTAPRGNNRLPLTLSLKHPLFFRSFCFFSFFCFLSFFSFFFLLKFQRSHPPSLVSLLLPYSPSQSCVPSPISGGRERPVSRNNRS